MDSFRSKNCVKLSLSWQQPLPHTVKDLISMCHTSEPVKRPITLPYRHTLICVLDTHQTPCHPDPNGANACRNVHMFTNIADAVRSLTFSHTHTFWLSRRPSITWTCVWARISNNISMFCNLRRPGNKHVTATLPDYGSLNQSCMTTHGEKLQRWWFLSPQLWPHCKIWTGYLQNI